jgi:SAM-dependent methyltransferase
VDRKHEFIPQGTMMAKLHYPSMTAWWHSPMGQLVQDLEQAEILSLEHSLYGDFNVQLGGTRACFPDSKQTVSECLVGDDGSIMAHAEALPFKSHSIDNMLLLHVLEHAVDPHQLLRETDRVLSADGKIILLAFNPLSLWGLRKLFSWRNGRPWDGHFFMPYRLKDWLSLLNYEVIEQRKIMYAPPVTKLMSASGDNGFERYGQRFWSCLGGVTMMVAAKRTIPVTPIKAKWQKRRLFMSPNLVKPLTREPRHGSR